MLTICLFIGIFGISKAYENTKLTGFGEYKKAVDYEDGVLRILDFEIEIF